MRIRIINVTDGEAPEGVRRYWVGMVLPLAPGETGPRYIPNYCVLTMPRTYFGQLWRYVTGIAPESRVA